jgi:hypothetical protein
MLQELRYLDVYGVAAELHKFITVPIVGDE